MNEKIKIIILIVIFIVMLVGVKMLMDYENNDIAKTTQTNMPENQIIEEEEEMEEAILEVTEENFESEVLNSDKKVLIDFYAEWCGPCHMLSPIVAEVAKSNTDIKVVKINIDNSQSLAIEYGVMSIPTLVVMNEGKEVNRSVGLISKSAVEQLVK